MDLEYPEERKRSFDKSVRTKIAFTEHIATVMTSPSSDDVDRPGKKLKLHDSNNDADPDHNNPSQIGYAADGSPSGNLYIYPTSDERTNWWDDECEEATTCNSLNNSGGFTEDKVMEDQVESAPSDVPRGRPTSTSSPLVTSISRRSRSADSPPVSPQTLQHPLLNETSALAENPFADPADSGDDFADDEGFKAYFDMTEAGGNYSKDNAALSFYRGRKRSKSLTPPTSPPKAKPYDLIYSSIDETEKVDIQHEFSGYPSVQMDSEGQELQSMDVEFPSIYSSTTSSENGSNFFEFGAAETREPLGLGLTTHDVPTNPSSYDSHPNSGNPANASNIQHPLVHQPVAGPGGHGSVDDANFTAISSVPHTDEFQEVTGEVGEDNYLWKAEWELYRRGLYIVDHIGRFHFRMSQGGSNPPDRNTPRRYSPLGFYPQLSASGLPAYLRLKELEEEGKPELDSPKSASDTRSMTAASPSWSDLDEDEDNDYFKELPLF